MDSHRKCRRCEIRNHDGESLFKIIIINNICIIFCFFFKYNINFLIVNLLSQNYLSCQKYLVSLVNRFNRKLWKKTLKEHLSKHLFLFIRIQSLRNKELVNRGSQKESRKRSGRSLNSVLHKENERKVDNVILSYPTCRVADRGRSRVKPFDV